MKNIILISEENHGPIGAAENIETAIKFLIETDWINANTEIYNDNDSDDFILIKELFGDNWQEKLYHMNSHDIRELFDGAFYFHPIQYKETKGDPE